MKSTANKLTETEPTPAEHKHGVDVASFDEKSDALKLVNILRSKEIEAHLHDERMLQRFWFWVSPKAGVHVCVPPESFRSTTALLESLPEAQGVIKKAAKCPKCHSLRVQYPAMTRKNFLPTLFAQLMVLIGISSHEYYCEDCHTTWKKGKTARLRKQATTNLG